MPRTTLTLTYAELVTATGISADAIQCKDQFLLRLELHLSDGRSFSIDDGSSSAIIAFDTIFSSPFCYTLNICLLYTSPSPRDQRGSRMPSSA